MLPFLVKLPAQAPSALGRSQTEATAAALSSSGTHVSSQSCFVRNLEEASCKITLWI